MDIAKLSTIALICLLGAMSPGPDFAVVTKNCISGTFRKGVLTSLGVASALLIHLSYCVLGVAVLIKESPLLFNGLKYIGAAYLLYLGVLLLKEKTSPEGKTSEVNAHVKKQQHPFVSGFLCNLLNPKATLFVLSVFTQFVDPGTSILNKILIASIFPIVGAGWFIFLSYLITHRFLQKHFARFQKIITKVMGVALCLLAVYVVFQ